MEKKFYGKKLTVLFFTICFTLSCFSSVSLADDESEEPVQNEEEFIQNEEESIQNEVLVLYENEPDSDEAVQIENSNEIEILSESETETIALVEIPDNMTVDEALEEYGQEEGVLAVTPNYTLELYDNAGTFPNDKEYGKQSYLDQVNVKEAWSCVNAASHEKVRVAVLDTGADISHPDLQNVLNLSISGEVLKDGTLGPLKGDDYINGVNTGAGTGHGTHVCGILAAEANNIQGIAGVGSCINNSAIELMVVDVFSNVKTTSLSNLIYGMEYAAKQGAKVINLSLGIGLSEIPDDTILKAECDKLYNRNITLVCAAGNEGRYDGGRIADVPCDYDSTIGVISVNERNARASFSNYGTRKDIAAPGVGIYSTLKDSSYGYKDGTSMSTAVVSAAAGMMYSLDPSITPEKVKTILINTSYALAGGGSNGGVVNCGKAMRVLSGSDYSYTLPFVDIDADSWYYEPACYVYQRGIMTGLSESVFGPTETLSRAQFAVILHRMNGKKEMSYWSAFPDVKEGTWYTNAVLWASEQGVVMGYETGNFGPADNITREQMAVMMYRYAIKQGYDVSGKVSYDQYTDASRVSPFASEAMRWAVGTGIIRGKDSETRIDPQGNTARIECATIIKRFEEKYNAQKEN